MSRRSMSRTRLRPVSTLAVSALAVSALVAGAGALALPADAAEHAAQPRVERHRPVWLTALRSTHPDGRPAIAGASPRALAATRPTVGDPYAVHAGTDGLHWTDLVTRATGIFAQTGSDQVIGEPVISRDGSHVAYAFQNGVTASSGSYTDGIAVFAVGSTGKTVLTNNTFNGDDTTGAPQLFDADPAFAASGTTLAFDREVDTFGATPTSTVGIETIRTDSSQTTPADGARTASNPSYDGAGNLDYLDQTPLVGDGTDCLVKSDLAGGAAGSCLLTITQAASQLPGSPDPTTVGGYDLRAATVGNRVAVSFDFGPNSANRTVLGLLTPAGSNGALTTYPATLLDGNRYAVGQADIDPTGTQLSFDRLTFDAGGTPTASGLYELDLTTGTHLAGFASPAVGGGSTYQPLPATPTGSAYLPLASPVRVLDTRSGTGAPAGRIGPGGHVDVQLTGSAVPAGATAVVLNLTAIYPTQNTYLQAYPTPTDSSAGTPLVSNVNLNARQTVANAVTVALPANGSIRIGNLAGTIDVAADLVGYYATSTSGGASLFAYPATPVRVLDTRDGTGGAPVARLGAGSFVDLSVANHAGVPADATAVVLSVGGIAHTTGTFVSVYPTPSQPQTTAPTTSTINLGAADTRENLATVGIGAGGAVRFYNNAGSTDVFADVVGYYQPAADGGDTFVPVTPSRAFDTRYGTNPAYNAIVPVRAQAAVTAVLRGRLTTSGGTNYVDPRAVAAQLNVTATTPTATTFLSLAKAAPSGTPTFSAVDAVRGQTIAAAAVTAISSSGEAYVYNNAGSTQVILDLAGYFLPAS